MQTMQTTMRAAVYRSFGGPIEIGSLPRPKAPQDGVVVQVMAAGVCRSDWHGWRGHDDYVVEHGLPFVPGHEFSGIVVEIGDLVTQLRVNDRVAVPVVLSCGHCRECDRLRPTVCEDQHQVGFTMNGAFAEYVAVSRADDNICPLPPSVSFVEAAALGCRLTTAYRAVVQQGKVDEYVKSSSQSCVAVFGCGGLGLSCVMVAKARGVSRIIATDVSVSALTKAEELGATDIVDASLGDDHVRSTVLELTDGLGADMTVDAAGFASTCENAVWCARRGGRMVQVGLPVGGVDPIIPMGRVAGREIEIVGSHVFVAADMPKMLQLVERGLLNPKALVEKEVTLEEGAQAIECMDKGSPLGITMIICFSAQSRL